MPKIKQDATEQEVGYIYQYLFAVSECLKLECGSIVVENYGDVSVLDDDGNIKTQYEIKFHKGISSLTSRSEDFWKSIYNWLNNYEISINCEKLILYTTSKITETSVFHNWNTLSELEKFEKIDSIYKKDENKSRVSEDRKKHYEVIFSLENHEKLLNILKKLIIEDNSDDFSLLRKKIMNSRLMILFNEEEKKILVDSLFSNLINIPAIKLNEKWKYSYQEIIKLLSDLKSRLNFDDYVIEEVIPNVDITDDIRKSYDEKRFVAEIRRIEYEEQIDTAIKDYFKANRNLDVYFKDRPSFDGEYSKYIENIEIKIKDLKQKRKLEISNDSSIINNSKIFYHDGLNTEVDTILKFNSESIRKGIVHIVVDEGKVTWYLGDE